jgi:hypothetical protein
MKDFAGLFNWLGYSRGFSASGEYFVGDAPPDRSLLQILDLAPDMLKPFTLEMLESEDDNDFIRSLKSGFRAFCEFQDIFPLTIKAKDLGKLDYGHLINRNYCYYESLVYLRSSMIAALDKNPIAAITVLRPFLELAVLHLYWFSRCEIEGYGKYYEWLDGRREKPGFRNQLDEIVKKLPARKVIHSDRLQRLSETLRNAYKTLCSYNHSPRMDESLASMSGGQTGMSLDSFYYYLASVDLLLSQIIYLYVLAYPMILFPVDRQKKWGVAGPIGIYVERNSYTIVEAFLKKESADTLRTSLMELTHVTSLLKSFDNQPDLGDEERENEWISFVKRSDVKENPSEWPERMAMNKAYSRALGWSLNYVHAKRADEEVDHEEVKKIFEWAKSW